MVACPNIAAGTEVSWSSVLMNLPGWSKINTQFRKTQPALAYRSHRYCWIGACHPGNGTGVRKVVFGHVQRAGVLSNEKRASFNKLFRSLEEPGLQPQKPRVKGDFTADRSTSTFECIFCDIEPERSGNAKFDCLWNNRRTWAAASLPMGDRQLSNLLAALDSTFLMLAKAQLPQLPKKSKP